jgi:hypothetical protein
VGVGLDHPVGRDGAGLGAARGGATAGLPAEDDDSAVPGEGGRVPAARALGEVADAWLADGVEERRVLQAAAGELVGADVEDVGGIRAGAGGQVDLALDHAHVVAAGRHAGDATEGLTKRKCGHPWLETRRSAASGVHRMEDA